MGGAASAAVGEFARPAVGPALVLRTYLATVAPPAQLENEWDADPVPRKAPRATVPGGRGHYRISTTAVIASEHKRISPLFAVA